MAGDTGQGQTATIFAQSIPNVQSIEVNNTGEVLRETVADGVLTAALGTGWEFTINFIAPTTGTHTLEGAIKAGESGSYHYRERSDQVHVKRGPQRGVS
jgi:hypothetical protein